MLLRPFTRRLPALIHRPQFYSTPHLQEESYADLQRSLAGTAQAHQCLLLLNSPKSPQHFSQRHSTRIQRDLQLSLRKLGAIVNFAWYGTDAPATHDDGEESGVAFTPLGGRLFIPRISADNLHEVVQTIERHIQGSPTVNEDDEIHLYVCTHGARDCRCGNTGGKVVEALRREVSNLSQTSERRGPKIRIGEVGHVGGHQYAANLLVYPHGEWLGLVRPENVPEILTAILERAPKPFTSTDPPLLPSFWRGRMGLGKDEQLELFNQSRGTGMTRDSERLSPPLKPLSR